MYNTSTTIGLSTDAIAMVGTAEPCGSISRSTPLEGEEMHIFHVSALPNLFSLAAVLSQSPCSPLKFAAIHAV